MLIETDKEIIGKKFRKYRRLKQLTQSQLAELVDLNEKQIYRIEAGLNYPTYTTFAKLLKVLEIDIQEFEINTDVKINPLFSEIINIIKNSSNTELKIYVDVLKSIRKNLKNSE